MGSETDYLLEGSQSPLPCEEGLPLTFENFKLNPFGAGEQLNFVGFSYASMPSALEVIDGVVKPVEPY